MINNNSFILEIMLFKKYLQNTGCRQQSSCSDFQEHAKCSDWENKWGQISAKPLTYQWGICGLLSTTHESLR